MADGVVESLESNLVGLLGLQWVVPNGGIKQCYGGCDNPRLVSKCFRPQQRLACVKEMISYRLQLDSIARWRNMSYKLGA